MPLGVLVLILCMVPAVALVPVSVFFSFCFSWLISFLCIALALVDDKEVTIHTGNQKHIQTP